MLSITGRTGPYLKSRKLRREKPQVWLLPSARLGYIQIPKVASRSIRASIIEMARDEITIDTDRQDIADKAVEELFSRHVARKQLAKLPGDYFLFAFVRNPLTRLYSAYANKLLDSASGGTRNIFAHMGMSPGMPFEDFVMRVAELKDHQIDRHLRSQHWFLTYEDKLFVDYIGKMENLSADWKELQTRFRVPALPHKNSSSAADPDSWQPFTRRLAEVAIERYREDIELFGYTEEVQRLLDDLG